MELMHYEGRDSRRERRRKARRNLALIVLTGLIGALIVLGVLLSVNRASLSNARRFNELHAPGRR